MKGQIFVLTSIMILVILLLVRSSTNTQAADQSDQFYLSFSNLEAELTKTVDLALVNRGDVAASLDDFISFSKDVYSRHGYTESVNYTLGGTSVYLNVSLRSSDSYFMNSLIINRTVYG